MAEPLRPGVFTELFASLAAQMTARAATAMEAAAMVVRQQAVDDVTQQSHPYGTKTPASPGGPPAMISGTLGSSIGQSAPEIGPAEVQIKVGMIPGRYPWYSGRTPASLYARYLNVDGAGRSRVLYPFLAEALEGSRLQATQAYRRVFERGGWKGIG